jgi:ATP-dependent helicase/nuclease subunit A
VRAGRHGMILASAGSGKTFALTNRFIRLLTQGARPERIVALTFTRKAAGEFFDEILNKLARAAAEPAAATKLAAAIGVADTGPAQFCVLLRAVVDAMPRLRLGTLDRFFARIVRTFPFELGLAGDFELLEEHAARREHLRVLRRMFLRLPGGLNTAQKEFIEAFKRATFGGEEKRLGVRLDAFLQDYQEIFLAAPEAGAWGAEARIWPHGSRWVHALADPAPAIAALREWLAGADLREKQRQRWDDFLEAVAAAAPGVSLPEDAEYILKKALESEAELRAGPTTLKFDRLPQNLSGRAAAALAELAVFLVAAELARRQERTRGIQEVLQKYESIYHDAVRREGKLTFADVQRLLQPMRLTANDAGGPRESNRLAIDYRLDGEIDHWLLDEFQDTSAGQWSILRNLIDEAVQDPEEVRSLFWVGDVKQSIYAWREGDPRLFREIFDHYNAAAPGTITEGRLVDSWRSGPAVIDLVNAVFGNGPALTEIFPGSASEDWNREWRNHTSAVPDRGGQAALLHAAHPADRWQLTLELLKEIDPLRRGLSCAILVPRNDLAAELADFLRAAGGLPVIAESDRHVCTDNPVGVALLAMVQTAAHPGDRLAREHVRMTPLGALLAREGLGAADALSVRLLGEFQADGFERTLAAWVRRLEPELGPDDAFSRRRARQVVAAAGAFDATGSRSPDEFVEFMQRYTEREAEGDAVIRVMTIHKAKGLGFDLVILPDLEGQRLAQRREGLAVQKAADRSVEWILDLPSKLYRTHDPVLAAHVRDAEAAVCYEQLSLLYVALTRAKRGLYVITKPIGKSTSENFPRLLSDTLGALAHPIRIGGLMAAGPWSSGDPDWHTQLPPPAPPPAPRAEVPLLARSAAPAARGLVARRPSAETGGSFSAAKRFSLEGGGEAEFGRRVHALLAKIGWADAPDRARLGRELAEEGAAGAEAAACLRSPDLAGVWERPAGRGADLWRERPFEAVVDGAWVSGVFDRVGVVLGATGRPVSATVYDFKTDRIDPAADLAAAAERHAGQLEWYRQAVRSLTGLPDEAVAGEIIFTHLRRRVRVPPV